MALRIGAIVLHASDTARSATFWAEALALTPTAANPEFLVPETGEHPRLHLDAEDRAHIDLWTDSRVEQDAEVTRLVGLGARRVDWDYPDDADFVVLADPGGTLFCVVNTGT